MISLPKRYLLGWGRVRSLEFGQIDDYNSPPLIFAFVQSDSFLHIPPRLLRLQSHDSCDSRTFGVDESWIFHFGVTLKNGSVTGCPFTIPYRINWHPNWKVLDISGVFFVFSWLDMFFSTTSWIGLGTSWKPQIIRVKMDGNGVPTISPVTISNHPIETNI